MRNRTAFAQTLGLVITLLSLTGFAALGTTAAPTSSAPVLARLDIAELDIAEIDCADLITPDTIGHEAFRRYGLADKLEENRFAAYEFMDYVVCSTEGLVHLEEIPWLKASMYYMFDRESGQLSVTYVEWAGPSAQPAPTPTRAPLVEIADAPVDDSQVTTVCIDAKTPILEIGGENPEQFDFWGILGNAPCGKDISSSICLNCDEDVIWRWLVPTSAGRQSEPSTGEQGGGATACFDAQMAVEITGQELDDADARRLAGGLCSMQFGPGDQVCWHCMEEIPVLEEPTPTPVPEPRAPRDPVCSEYLTPEVVGREAWQKYGIADKLRANQIHRHLSDRIVCYGGRRIDGVDIDGDRLYYMFDIESGQLLVERIHWREDLPDQLPSPRISQQEAESMVEGEVNQSGLVILNPDQMHFETDRMSSFTDPCWIVSSTQRQGDFAIPWWTVINAITGEVLGSYSALF